ncbi:unnamed protein product [Rotaria socialis]|uniref:Uncharacterized protein n=1 Tax=Rotaria socialis TaxID=392032 RepID=A0A821FNZ5_9BILA|nr:unnamed protein product [Rotaria socialis]CAF4655716.1 unnamed protein product [Rotaria socialis]
MSSTATTIAILPNDTANYSIVVPISVGFAILAVICSALILVTIVSHRRRMHTANHLLIGDICAWSIFCCAAQSNHFILIGIQWILAILEEYQQQSLFFADIDIFYWICIVFLSLTVAVKNSVTLFLDRELFNALKKFIRRRNTRVMPVLS